jgi:rhodanese-related sulfurtransferase
MRPRAGDLPARILAVALPGLVALAAVVACAARAGAVDDFEIARSHVQTWLSSAPAGSRVVSAEWVKRTIVDDWDRQADRYRILSVRSPADDSLAGHIPHAVNVYWPTLLTDESLACLDPSKTTIVACYYGHASMLCCTILGLLGYPCRSLDFGMMGWNRDALVKQPWDREADYPVETAAGGSPERYPLPVITGAEHEARSLIRQRARAYLEGEGSPVIAAAAVKAIVDDWDRKRAEYQIVCVEPGALYRRGHVPHALDIPLPGLARTASLRRLDPAKTILVYSRNGQTGQCAATLLNLLGYRAVAMRFGMMDWNCSYVDPADQWHEAAGYPVEQGGNSAR